MTNKHKTFRIFYQIESGIYHSSTDYISIHLEYSKCYSCYSEYLYEELNKQNKNHNDFLKEYSE